MTDLSFLSFDSSVIRRVATALTPGNFVPFCHCVKGIDVAIQIVFVLYYSITKGTFVRLPVTCFNIFLFYAASSRRRC